MSGFFAGRSYYAEGNHVCVAAIRQDNGDGTTSISFGIGLLVVNEFIKNSEAVAEAIAGLLNAAAIAVNPSGMSPASDGGGA